MNPQTTVEMTPLLSPSPSPSPQSPQAAGMSLEDAIDALQKKGPTRNDFKIAFGSHPNPLEEIKRKKLLFSVVAEGKRKAFDILFVLLPVVDTETLLAVDANGKTVLHVAVENDHERCTDAIIRKERTLLSRGDNEGNTPLHYMVRLERVKACQKAVAFCSPNVINQPNKNSLSAVHFAARERCPEIMKIFLDKGGDPKSLTNQLHTPLHFAAQSGSVHCMKYLLEKIPDPNDQIRYLNIQTDIGLTALMVAVKQGFVVIAKELLKTDLTLKSKDGNTALHHAALKGSFHLVRMLLTACVEQNDNLDEDKARLISLKNKNFIVSSLTAAIAGKNDMCFSHLLKKSEIQLTDADVKQLVAAAATTSLKCVQQMAGRPEFDEHLAAYRNGSGDSLLHLAITMKSFATAKELLDKTNVDKFAKNKNEDSALHMMARLPQNFLNGHEDEKRHVTRKLLMESRELVKSVNKARETPLHLAAQSGNVDLVKAFLAREPNILSETRKKITPIHMAAEKGHIVCLEMLLRSLKSQDYHKLRGIKPHPLHFAAGNGHVECCELLLTASLVGENPEEALELKAPNGQYPVDKAFRGEHADVFSYLLGKMKFKKNDEFAVRLHRYFKRCLTALSENMDSNQCAFKVHAIEAIIGSSWCKVVFDRRFCNLSVGFDSNTNKKRLSSSCPQPAPISNASIIDEKTLKPCRSFALLIKTLPNLAYKAMDKYITVLPNSSYELHDYAIFEYIYYCIDGKKLVSPFEEEELQTPPRNTTSQQSGPVTAPSNASQGASSATQTRGGAALAKSQFRAARNRVVPGSNSTNITSSSATNPTNPNTANPTNPNTANPTNPNTANPTNPNTANPTNPNTANPTNPNAANPTNSNTANPTNSNGANPTNFNAANPTSSSIANPTNSNAVNPMNFKAANSNNANVMNRSNIAVGSASNQNRTNRRMRSGENSNPVSTTQNLPQDSQRYERRLKADTKEFVGTSWGEDHPLQEAVKGGHTKVLCHKLTKSWLMKKFSYARWVLYPYVALDILTAAFVYGLQALLWNSRRLEKRFSGTTEQDVSAVYDSDVSHNTSVADLVQAVRSVAVNDSHCATWEAGDSQEIFEPGSAQWNKSVCTLYHLEQQQPLVVSMELCVLFLALLHMFLEHQFFRPTSLAIWDVHRVSRLVLRLPFMIAMLCGTSLADFALGSRPIIVWQLGVVAVLICWIHVVFTLNKVPRFSGFMPVTPMLLLRYVLAVVPLLLFLWAFALTFHLLFFDLLPFATVPYSLLKTVTWLLGDLGYDDTFRDGESPLDYPFLSNLLFAVFILWIGGLVFNFVIGHPTDRLLGLRKEDDLNRAIAHLHIHLLIDECVPNWRRKYARSHGVKTDVKDVSLYVSSEMLQFDMQNEEPSHRDFEKLVEEVANIKNELKTNADFIARQ